MCRVSLCFDIFDTKLSLILVSIYAEDNTTYLGVSALPGIVVGYVILLAVIIFLVAMLCWKRHKNTQTKG
jgi:hypothetical protein